MRFRNIKSSKRLPESRVRRAPRFWAPAAAPLETQIAPAPVHPPPPARGCSLTHGAETPRLQGADFESLRCAQAVQKGSVYLAADALPQRRGESSPYRLSSQLPATHGHFSSALGKRWVHISGNMENRPSSEFLYIQQLKETIGK